MDMVEISAAAYIAPFFFHLRNVKTLTLCKGDPLQRPAALDLLKPKGRGPLVETPEQNSGFLPPQQGIFLRDGLDLFLLKMFTEKHSHGVRGGSPPRLPH
jgi:hypothetical protein